MKIGFYSSRMKFEADLTENGIAGGSENALVNLAKKFKKNFPNNEIIIYSNNSGKYNEYCGITWKTITDFNLEIVNGNFDAVISLREPEMFSLPYIDSKLKILWSQDICNESGLQNLKKNKYCIENIDLILSNSEFSYRDLKKNFPNSDIEILLNGYNSELISSNIKKEDSAIYCSTPFRGLDLLANYWPDIYNKLKHYNIDAKLKIFGDMSLYNQSNGPYKELYKQLSNLPNVEVFGSVPQSKLYNELQKSLVMLYPNTWLETSCMATLEAIACGVWIVTSDYGALHEQVKDGENGNLITSDPGSIEYKEKFINSAVSAFVNKPISNRKHVNSWSNQSKLLRNMIVRRIK